MAKKTKVDIAEYINGLPGLDDDTKKLMAEKLAASPDAAKRLQDELMSSRDYQSHMAELEADRKAAADSKAAFEAKLAENQQWYNDNVSSGKMPMLEQQLAAYRATYGDFSTPQYQPQIQPQTQQYMSKQEVEALLAKQRSEIQDWTAGLNAKAVPLALQHYKEFGEVLDVNGLIQAAVAASKEPMNPLDTAYARQTAELRAARSAEAEKAKLEQARKDWERDYRSRQGGPATDRPEDHSILYSAMRKEPEKVSQSISESNRLNSFKQIWNEVGDELEKKEAALA